eukprot:m.143849 g.143849  ORF g.143849 m.143849 type:complete len:487 (+) comp11593_c0_seq28:2109-3569(+)
MTTPKRSSKCLHPHPPTHTHMHTCSTHMRPTVPRLADALLAHFLHQGAKFLLNGLSTQLVGSKKASVLNRPWSRLGNGSIVGIGSRQESHGNDLLERRQRLHGFTHHVCKHRLFNLLVATQLHGRPRDPKLLGQLLNLDHVGLGDHHGSVHVAVCHHHHPTVDGVDVDGLAVLLLHVLNGDILAPSKFHEVLEPVHNLNGPIRGPQANVARLKPAIVRKLRLGLVRQLEVALSDRTTANPQLTATQARNRDLAILLADHMLRVRGEVRLAHRVLHVGYRMELELNAREGRAGNAILDLIEILHTGRTVCLREAVALHKRLAQCTSDPRLGPCRERTAARDTRLEATANHLAQHGTKHESKHGSIRADTESMITARNHLANDGLDQWRHGANLGKGTRLEHVPHLGNTRHDSGTKLLNGARCKLEIGLVVDGSIRSLTDSTGGCNGTWVGKAKLPAHGDNDDFDGQFQNVRCGKVRQIHFFTHLEEP